MQLRSALKGEEEVSFNAALVNGICNGQKMNVKLSFYPSGYAKSLTQWTFNSWHQRLFSWEKN